MHYQNLEKLKRLRLFGMVPATPRPARALEDLQNLADRGQMDFADQLALLVDREATDRANTSKRLSGFDEQNHRLSRLRQARLRQTACFEDTSKRSVRESQHEGGAWLGQGHDP